MKETPLKKISGKQRQKLASEQKIKDEMIRQQLDAVGYIYCMMCGKRRPLEKSHTRDRKRFIMSCRTCHWPDGIHRYLDDYQEKIRQMEG